MTRKSGMVAPEFMNTCLLKKKNIFAGYIKGERMNSVEVFSVAGQLIYRHDADTPEFTQIDMANFASGHYLVKVTLDDGKIVTREIIMERR